MRVFKSGGNIEAGGDSLTTSALFSSCRHENNHNYNKLVSLCGNLMITTTSTTSATLCLHAHKLCKVVHALLKLNQYLEICSKIKNTFLFLRSGSFMYCRSLFIGANDWFHGKSVWYNSTRNIIVGFCSIWSNWLMDRDYIRISR